MYIPLLLFFCLRTAPGALGLGRALGGAERGTSQAPVAVPVSAPVPEAASGAVPGRRCRAQCGSGCRDIRGDFFCRRRLRVRTAAPLRPVPASPVAAARSCRRPFSQRVDLRESYVLRLSGRAISVRRPLRALPRVGPSGTIDTYKRNKTKQKPPIIDSDALTACCLCGVPRRPALTKGRPPMRASPAQTVITVGTRLGGPDCPPGQRVTGDVGLTPRPGDRLRVILGLPPERGLLRRSEMWAPCSSVSLPCARRAGYRDR